MKLKLLLAIFASFLSIGVVNAEERVTLDVSGVVCSFCAQGIQRKFEKTGLVESVSVDLDKHQVNLEFQDGKTMSDSEIGSLLESAGYNLLKVVRISDSGK